MRHIRICAVVNGKTIEEFLKNLEKIQEISDFVELRVDYIKNLSIEDIIRISEKTKVKSIFTCRMTSEGGFYESNERERKTLIESAAQMRFDYVDLELSAVKHIDFSKLEKTKIVLSYHNFDKTPSLKELGEIKKKMKKYPVFCMKFATKITQDTDTVALMQLLLDKEMEENMIIVGMNDKGKMTRIIGPLLGSYCTFASSPFSQSAPGQIDIHTLQNIYASMGKEIPYGR